MQTERRGYKGAHRLDLAAGGAPVTAVRVAVVALLGVVQHSWVIHAVRGLAVSALACRGCDVGQRAIDHDNFRAY